MEDSKKLIKFCEHIEKIHLFCHKTVNRAVNTIAKYPDSFELLTKFTKELIVLEKLCEYLSNLCYNSGKISKYAYKEYTYKCDEINKICKEMINLFHKEKDVCEYLRCFELESLLGVKKRKKKTKKRYSM